MFNPTDQWTEEERRDTILEILKEIDPPNVVSQAKVYDVGERICFLLTKSQKFLEVNRDAILEGQV